MTVRWSPLRVKQATEEIEHAIAGILPPLAEATRIIEQAEKIPHLPAYVSFRFNVLRNEIEKIAGTQRYGQPEGSLQRIIKGIRDELPAPDLAKEEAQFNKWLDLFKGDRQAAAIAMNVGTGQPDQPLLTGVAQAIVDTTGKSVVVEPAGIQAQPQLPESIARDRTIAVAEADERIADWESAMEEE